MEILFVGATWKGSSARSLREALTQLPTVCLDDIGEDNYLPNHRSKFLRSCNRLLRPWQVADLAREITAKIDALQPEVLMVYKGAGVTADLVRQVRTAGTFTVNVFPDCSPHAHGRGLQEAMGEYDLVISTKPFHPNAWQSTYDYSNRCVFVPHGYDPTMHYWPDPPTSPEFDVVLVASWRPEYEALMQALARIINDPHVRVGVAGPDWARRKADFPRDWVYGGAPFGRAYGEWLRRGKIAIAPVTREVTIAGASHPGDEDTTRTYELAAAHCFFLHRRTAYAQTVYDEHTEVPMWDGPQELAELVQYYLPREDERRSMAAAAHARAVPAYSIPCRAKQVLEEVRASLATRRSHGR